MTAARRGPPPRPTDSSVRLFSQWTDRMLEEGGGALVASHPRKGQSAASKRPGAQSHGAHQCVSRVAERVWVCVVHLDREGGGSIWNGRLRARARRVQTVFSDFLITCMSWRKL